MRFIFRVFALTLLFYQAKSQDSLYVRQCIKFLTSEKCFGRGYVKGGLPQAERFILNEIRKTAATPLFGANFTQSFFHPVNTFPGKCNVRINGKKLVPGLDYILDPASPSIKGAYALSKADSIHYVHQGKESHIQLSFAKKLTYSVALETSLTFGLHIDRKRFNEEPRIIELHVANRLIAKFESKNIGCYINGTFNNDSLIVLSAHYDHLGGMGKHTFFPGANDNASGTSMLLDLIRHYSAHPPKYKTVFLFFAAEEAGLLGSKFFTASNTLDLKKIKFLVNLDLLGTGDDGIMVVNGALHEKEFTLLNQINSKSGLVAQIRKRGKAANSDHYWFSEAGVPCFFIYTMGGITAYHDVLDREGTLPLTDYKDVFLLLTSFLATF